MNRTSQSRSRNYKSIAARKAAIAAARTKPTPVATTPILFTVTSDGGRIRRGPDLAIMMAEFSPLPDGPDGGSVTVFQGDTDNVLYSGSPSHAASFVAAHPELFRKKAN